MSALLALGFHSFEILPLNYQKLVRSTSAEWARVSRFGGRPAKQFVGLGGNDDQEISGLLFPEEFGGRDEYEAIRLTQGNGQPVMMIGNGATGFANVFGMVVIEEVSDTQTFIGPDGQGRKLEFSVTVSPY